MPKVYVYAFIAKFIDDCHLISRSVPSSRSCTRWLLSYRKAWFRMRTVSGPRSRSRHRKVCRMYNCIIYLIHISIHNKTSIEYVLKIIISRHWTRTDHRSRYTFNVYFSKSFETLCINIFCVTSCIMLRIW